MRPGRDFWIDAVDFGPKAGTMRRVLYRQGGIRPAEAVEIALWDRLMSAKLLPNRPRWYVALRSEQKAEQRRASPREEGRRE